MCFWGYFSVTSGGQEILLSVVDKQLDSIPKKKNNKKTCVKYWNTALLMASQGHFVLLYIHNSQSREWAVNVSLKMLTFFGFQKKTGKKIFWDLEKNKKKILSTTVLKWYLKVFYKFKPPSLLSLINK